MGNNKWKNSWGEGAYITLHALSIVGLKCMEVPYSKLMSFTPNLARIK